MFGPAVGRRSSESGELTLHSRRDEDFEQRPRRQCRPLTLPSELQGTGSSEEGVEVLRAYPGGQFG